MSDVAVVKILEELVDANLGIPITLQAFRSKRVRLNGLPLTRLPQDAVYAKLHAGAFSNQVTWLAQGFD